MDRYEVKSIAEQHEISIFVPRSGVKIAIEDADEQGGNNILEDDEDDGKQYFFYFIFFLL